MSEQTITVHRHWRDKPLQEKKRFDFNGVRVERYGRRVHLLGADWPAETAHGVGVALIELAEAARAEPDPESMRAIKDVLVNSAGLGDLYDLDVLARDLLAGFDVKKRRQL